MTLPSPLALDDRLRARFDRQRLPGLPPRMLALAVLFAVEMLLLSVWLDNDALVARGGVFILVGHWSAWVVRGTVGFAALFVTFAYLRSRPALSALSRQVESAPLRRLVFVAHLLAMAAFALLCRALYGGQLSSLSPGLALALWLIAGFSAIVLAALALLPLNFWADLIRATGPLWAAALALAVTACIAGSSLRALWAPAARLTFLLAKICIRPFVSGIVADPASMLLGTSKFVVQIAPECSGFEGIGLMLVFSLGWLWIFRREVRFPRALILIPLGAIAIFVLNALRIAALILIGNAGAPGIALGGFHSQAGWIAFNAVALGFSVAATRVRWLRNANPPGSPAVHATLFAPAASLDSRAAPNHPVAFDPAAAWYDSPSAAYLLPLLVILAVGMFTTAASSGFEWLYPLRLAAAAAVLWALRRRYATLGWSFTWFGPAIGIAVFVLWIAIDRLQHSAAREAIPTALAATSAPLRIGWIALRILAAVVTVPIAEELAFRGFAIRRLVATEFEALPLTRYSWLALGASSLAFGLLHGHLWIAGTVAGLLYAWALLRRGHIGEAVAAHATTNALLAAYVLLFQQWHLW